MKLSLNPASVLASMDVFNDKFEASLSLLASTGAKKMESYAKNNANWVDRTGDARKRLSGKSEKSSKGYVIKISHGVDYGIWLELIQEKRYAILEDTVTQVGKREVIPALNNFLDRVN